MMLKSKSNINILIIEDEFIIAEDLKRILHSNGYMNVFIASTPDQSLFMLSSVKPDLILMDINLNSELDGIDLCSQIRAISTVPILFVTAHGDQVTINRLKPFKPNGIILKPYSDLALLANIEIILYNASISLQNKRDMVNLLFD